MLRYHRIVLFALFFIGWMVMSIQPAAAWTQVTLAWSSNTEPDLAGYRAFSRLEGGDYAYNDPTWEGTDTTCTIDTLEESSVYCFVVRAFDTEGYESADSEEVCTGNIASSPQSPSQKNLNAEIGENENDSSGGCFIDSLSR